jgi:hypothetical protein
VRRIAALGLAWGLLGCQDFDDSPWLVEGTTWRIDEPQFAEGGDVKIDIFANRVDCLQADEVDETEIEDCIPRVDRGTGQVEIAFRLVDKATSDTLYLPLTKEQVNLAHQGSAVVGSRWELIQHGPMRAGQLFIVIIDGSASIYETGGIEKIKKALLTETVIDAFMPENSTEAAAVMLLRFSEDVRTIEGGDPRLASAIIKGRADYKRRVNEHLHSNDRGYSHLYDAVSFASGPLLESPEVRNWLQVNRAQPTIVILTDGFNNEQADDVCKDNVQRLKDTVDVLARVRAAGGSYKPTVFTVGLGDPIRAKFTLPAGGAVSEPALCNNYADQRIDGGLEAKIDNPSLEWIADAGGGRSFIKTNHKGLAEVFTEAAAQRFKWYELRYDIDTFYHRSSFTSLIRLDSGGQAESSVSFHPSAWLDAPSGEVAEGELWHRRTAVRRSTVLVMSILGGLVFLGFVGPATFNARRALFRRARRR